MPERCRTFTAVRVDDIWQNSKELLVEAADDVVADDVVCIAGAAPFTDLFLVQEAEGDIALVSVGAGAGGASSHRNVEAHAVAQADADGAGQGTGWLALKEDVSRF